jgi:hypothetical protein
MFSRDPFDVKDGSEFRLKSFKIYWGVTATTSGIIFIILLFLIADDLEDGWLKKMILKLRPRWSVFRKRKNGKQRRQDSMKKEQGASPQNTADGAGDVVDLRGGSLGRMFLKTRKNQVLGSLA